MKTLKLALAAFGLFMLIGGYVYGHSDSFKQECIAHKLFDYDMGSVKNLICDAEFDIDTK